MSKGKGYLELRNKRHKKKLKNLPARARRTFGAAPGLDTE
jgi:hypothetical protein